MQSNTVFNITVCILGVLILLVHTVILIVKRNKRKDDIYLLVFFVFTMVHFATYFSFALIKETYTSNAFIMAFYTIFYIMNNIEVFLFYLYMSFYMEIPSRIKKVTDIINIVLFASFVLTDILNIFTYIYFHSDAGVYVRSDYMIISQGYQFALLAISFVLAICNKTINSREKAAFILYCTLPIISIILQNLFKGYAIAYATMIVAIEILFLFLNIEKNIKIQEEERQLKDANIKIMVSQIRPHFIYNTLSSISTLIPIDPNKAQIALDEFTEYLRMNFSTLTEDKVVSFEDELKHIQTYVDLEKLRFNERLKVIYDIKATNFDVPPLSIQPLVENAVKHGILKKVEGGTLTLKSYETNEAFIVEVIDDGVGFDINNVDFDSNIHIGLNNVKYRINSMIKGEITFDSKINEGTKIVVKIFKKD